MFYWGTEKEHGGFLTSFTSSGAKLNTCYLFIFTADSWILLIVYIDLCYVTDPFVVVWDPGIDAILPVFGTLLSPADDACQEPSSFVIGGMRPTAVPLARVLLFTFKACTEHKSGDMVSAALFTFGAVHIGDFQLLELGGLGALKPYPAPSTHKGDRGFSHNVLYEFFGAQANGTPLVGQVHWTAKL